MAYSLYSIFFSTDHCFDFINLTVTKGLLRGRESTGPQKLARHNFLRLEYRRSYFISVLINANDTSSPGNVRLSSQGSLPSRDSVCRRMTRNIAQSLCDSWAFCLINSVLFPVSSHYHVIRVTLPVMFTVENVCHGKITSERWIRLYFRLGRRDIRRIYERCWAQSLVTWCPVMAVSQRCCRI